MKELPEDLQRILKVNAKIYHTKTRKQGKVIAIDDEGVEVEYGNLAGTQVETYPIEEFKQSLLDDEIVANYRLTIGTGNNFKVNPRSGASVSNTPHQQVKTGSPAQSINQPNESAKAVEQPKLEVGYINFKSGKFSTEHKKGYTKVEYRKATQKVTLEIDEDQLKKLKEMGLV